MKCIKDVNGKISRVSDEAAVKAVNAGTHTFCPKCEYKAQNGKIPAPKYTGNKPRLP